VKTKIKNLIVGILPNFLINHITTLSNEYLNVSYAQEGEDMILARFLKNIETGFYVDIGAHHPKRFSNTYKFYLLGWTGINIDAIPTIEKDFKIERENDINYQSLVSNENLELDFYLMNDYALNTTCKQRVDELLKVEGNYVKSKITLKSKTLSYILDTFLNKKNEIDFLSIDVEGNELNVLKSNDWIKYNPKYIVIEEIFGDIKTIFDKSEVYTFLNSLNYELVARTFNTSIYKLK
jgi:FkbM family methyltransferase